MKSDDPAPTREGPLPVPAATPKPVAPTREVSLPAQSRVMETREAFPAAGASRAPSSDQSAHHGSRDNASRDYAREHSRERDRSRDSRDTAVPRARSSATQTEKAADPVNKIYRSIRDVVADGVMIVKHPSDFHVRLGIDDEQMFARGSRFMLSCVPALFVLLLPVHLMHGRAVTQGFVGLLFTASVYVTAPLVHYALRLVGARKVPLATTIGLYAFQGCSQFMGYVLVAYPMALRFGSQVFFGTPEEQQAIVKMATDTDKIFFFFNWLFAIIVTGCWFLFGWTPLFARFYALKKPKWWRAFAALLIPLIISSILFQWLTPWFRKISDAM